MAGLVNFIKNNFLYFCCHTATNLPKCLCLCAFQGGGRCVAVWQQNANYGVFASKSAYFCSFFSCLKVQMLVSWSLVLIIFSTGNICFLHRKTLFSLIENSFFSRRKHRFLSAKMTFPDFTGHFFSSLAETVDGCFVVVLNR